jgi:catechol 2,3-dioxygenase-like lactoylglutathione lyase family enzyme
MLGKAAVHPTLPAVDINRARNFYENKLGLRVVKTDPSQGIVFEAGECTTLYVYKRGATKADHTVVSFTVEDVEAQVSELKEKGIVFEEYDIPEMGLKTVNGIAEMGEMKGAWFKDTEGNILALSNMQS